MCDILRLPRWFSIIVFMVYIASKSDETIFHIKVLMLCFEYIWLFRSRSHAFTHNFLSLSHGSRRWRTCAYSWNGSSIHATPINALYKIQKGSVYQSEMYRTAHLNICEYVQSNFHQSYAFKKKKHFQYRLAIIDFIGNDSKSHRLVRFLPGTQKLPNAYWSIYLFSTSLTCALSLRFVTFRSSSSSSLPIHTDDTAKLILWAQCFIELLQIDRNMLSMQAQLHTPTTTKSITYWRFRFSFISIESEASDSWKHIWAHWIHLDWNSFFVFRF